MAATVSYPVRVDASLEEPLSRWLWLVKWLLAIPHFIILAFLWVAFVVLTAVAFVAILLTGRYPRAIFDFNVGVLRWTWRVQYYTYGALGTDHYPPFTLEERADYPAHLHVDYPQHLSRGLVLVKWWLLALPQYLVTGFFVGGGTWLAWQSGHSGFGGGGGLIGLLVLVAGVLLLVTGSYPGPIYDFVLGMDRWVLRVAAYAGLMTDQYPPFRMDMGGHEQGGSLTMTGSPESGTPGLAGPTEPGERRGGWSAGRWLAVVAGGLLAVAAPGLVLAGGTLLLIDRTQRDDAGYLSLGSRIYATEGYALASTSFHLDAAGPGWLSWDHTIGTVRLRVTPVDDSRSVFVGVAPAAAARHYLAGMDRVVVGDGSVARLPRHERHVTGAPPVVLPTSTDIWVRSSVGQGRQTLRWRPVDGSWVAVAMNANGSSGVDLRVDAAVTAPALARAAYAAVGAGAGLAVLAVVLVFVAARRAGG